MFVNVPIGVLVMALADGRRQSRVPRPILPLVLFRDRNRTCAYAVVLLVGGSLSLTYFPSPHVQHVLGYSPIRARLASPVRLRHFRRLLAGGPAGAAPTGVRGDQHRAWLQVVHRCIDGTQQQ